MGALIPGHCSGGFHYWEGPLTEVPQYNFYIQLVTVHTISIYLQLIYITSTFSYYLEPIHITSTYNRYIQLGNIPIEYIHIKLVHTPSTFN